ncbi:MAG TPA: hypothetical protein VEA69_17920, partial [Tepidisphaeraceae bacterium]|nr:hypothetical protein [Tepidisphaeraceae bacterium]
MPEPLDYAPRPTRSPWPWRQVARRVARRCLVALLVVGPVAAVCVSVWAPWAWHGSRFAYDRHQLFSLTLPPTTVVYEEDEARAAALKRSAPGRALSSSSGDTWPAESDYVGEDFAEYAPAVFRGLKVNQYAGTLVLARELGTLRGRPRLVLIRRASTYANHSPPRIGVRLLAQSFPTNENSIAGNRGLRTSLPIALAPDQVFRLYAAQPDP